MRWFMTDADTQPLRPIAAMPTARAARHSKSRALMLMIAIHLEWDRACRCRACPRPCGDYRMRIKQVSIVAFGVKYRRNSEDTRQLRYSFRKGQNSFRSGVL